MTLSELKQKNPKLAGLIEREARAESMIFPGHDGINGAGEPPSYDAGIYNNILEGALLLAPLLEEMREALEFYANPSYKPDHDADGFAGLRAKKALKKYEELIK